MKGTSWYEPEKDRIVITDLDDFDDEPDPDPNLTISSALLDHIKAGPIRLPRPAPSMALVLFKPVLATDPHESPIVNDCAMDVEP